MIISNVLELMCGSYSVYCAFLLAFFLTKATNEMLTENYSKAFVSFSYFLSALRLMNYVIEIKNFSFFT